MSILCKKVSEKVRGHCHLTGKHRVTTHKICNKKTTHKQSSFIPFVFHKFCNYDCHLFLTKLVDGKNVKVKIEIIPKTNEYYLSIKHGCIRFIDSYRFLSYNLDNIVKILDND